MIAIIGGGITGLALGWELTQRGADAVVFEASDDVGGVIRSRVVDSRVIDLGPQRMRLTGAVARVVDALDLGDSVLTAPTDLPLYIFRDGELRTVPFSLSEMITSDIVSRRAKLRLLLEPLSRGADPRERVAHYFTRKLGREVYEVLVAPLYGGLYASDPADMQVGLSLIHVMQELAVGRSLTWRLLRRGGRVRPPPACSFEGGMQELPHAFAAALGPRVRVRCPIRALRRQGCHWMFEALGERVEASAVVVCTSAAAAASLVEDVAPESAVALRGLTYNPLAVVHLDSETELTGLGFQVAFTERRPLLRGVTFNQSLFGRPRLYTAYLGGALHPEVTVMSDEEVARAAVQEFASCTGYSATALAVSRTWMPAWDCSWSALRHLTLPDGLYAAGSWRSRPGLAGRLDEARGLACTPMPGKVAPG